MDAQKIISWLLRGAASAAQHAPPPVLLAVAIFVAGNPAAAGDATAGRQKAVQCQACHGLDGLSKLPEAPHIAGQPESYLIKSMNEYRRGIRKHELMTIVAKQLSENDVADLAAYYTAIELSVKQPGQ